MPVLRTIKQWAAGVLIALDQLGNSIAFGFPDETISSRLGRRKKRKRKDVLSEAGCAVLDAIQENHCGQSIEETPTGETDPHHLGHVIHEIPRDPASRLTKIRNAGFVVFLAIGLGSCEGVKIPHCPSGTTGQWPLCEVPPPDSCSGTFSVHPLGCPDPSPSVTPPPASPSPSPSVESSPVPPTPVPPTPKPPTPPPCPHAPACVQINPECESCAKWIGDRLSSGDLARHPNGLVYNDPGNNPAAREWFDPKTCFMVNADGSLRNKRLQLSGEVCVKCDAAPVPCATPSPDGTPQPGPTPATCPVLVRWGGGIHAQMNPQHQGLPKEPAFAGNTIDFDSTARFGSGRGQPCNDEHHAVCSASGRDDDPNWRHCEDPRGPVWEIVSCGGKEAKEINGGWGYRIVAVDRGKCCLSITPRRDVQDALGQPVRVGPNPGTETCVDVQ